MRLRPMRKTRCPRLLSGTAGPIEQNRFVDQKGSHTRQSTVPRGWANSIPDYSNFQATHQTPLLLVEARQRQCWECLRRRLVCDFQVPRCRRCRASGIDCPGYREPSALRVKSLAPGKVSCRQRKTPLNYDKNQECSSSDPGHPMMFIA